MAQSVAEVSREALEQAVMRFFHMCNTHCPGNLAPLMTPDVELRADREARGQEAVNAYFVELWEGYPELTFSVENLLVDGSSAVAEVSYSHGPGGAGDRCIVMQFKGSLIRRMRSY